MYFSSLTDRGATPALVHMLTFNESRLRMLSENIANVHTPGYRAKQLDVRGFQRALREALDARGGDPRKPFVVKGGNEVRTMEDGRLRVTPSRYPVRNLLFHDNTNLSLEQQMSDLAKTGMMHELVTSLLRGRYEGLRKAIRGTV